MQIELYDWMNILRSDDKSLCTFYLSILVLVLQSASDINRIQKFIRLPRGLLRFCAAMGALRFALRHAKLVVSITQVHE
jgi:hypothetical protein